MCAGETWEGDVFLHELPPPHGITVRWSCLSECNTSVSNYHHMAIVSLRIRSTETFIDAAYD